MIGSVHIQAKTEQITFGYMGEHKRSRKILRVSELDTLQRANRFLDVVKWGAPNQYHTLLMDQKDNTSRILGSTS